MRNYITISGKGPLPKIPTRKPANPLIVSKEALSSMKRSANIYLERINDELAYSESLAKEMPRVLELKK